MQPGDKVICIDDSHQNEFKGLVFQNWITKDKEYTIREIYDNDGITPGVLLVEVHNPIVPIPVLNRLQEPAFRIDRFRKLSKQSISSEVEEELFCKQEVYNKYYLA